MRLLCKTSSRRAGRQDEDFKEENETTHGGWRVDEPEALVLVLYYA
jgi:hypothetical protein